MPFLFCLLLLLPKQPPSFNVGQKYTSAVIK
jgi:hypothetical protein